MTFKISQNILSKSLNLVSRATSSKSNIDLLKYVMVNPKDGLVEMVATDLEIGIRTNINYNSIDEIKAFCIDAKLLNGFVSTLPQTELTLTINENILVVNNDSTKAEFPIADGREFPIVAKIDEENFLFSVDKKEFKKSLSQLLFAIAKDTSRPVLNGILFEVAEGNITLVSVDGYRLTKKHIIANTIYTGKINIFAKGLSEILSLETDSDEIRFYSNSKISEHIKQVIIKVGHTEIITRVLEGEFPDYNAILPKSKIFTCKFDKDVLSSSLKTVQSILRETIGHKVILSFDTIKKIVKISGEDIGKGSINSEIEIFEIEGEDIRCAYNVTYIMDYLNSVEGNIIKFQINSSAAPAEFFDEKDKDYLHIIMPMRID